MAQPSRLIRDSCRREWCKVSIKTFNLRDLSVREIFTRKTRGCDTQGHAQSIEAPNLQGDVA